jgi:hypothetical protein
LLPRRKEKGTLTHVNLDTQPEVVRPFVLALSVSAEGVVLESTGRPVACVVPPATSMKEPGTQDGAANGSRSRVEPYPVADFYEGVEFGWTEASDEVHQALKRYSEATHADPPDASC